MSFSPSKFVVIKSNEYTWEYSNGNINISKSNLIFRYTRRVVGLYYAEVCND